MLYERLGVNPVIAAVKDNAMLDVAARSECEVIFLLSGNICSVGEAVRTVHSAGKEVYMHIDLIEGFGRDKYALRYIKENISPDGIITTRSPLAKTARELGMTAIQRIFLIDGLSLETGIQSIWQAQPEAVEVLPGLMPEITKKICASVKVPVIAGGLISSKDDIINSLNAGAVGVSTSKSELWGL